MISSIRARDGASMEKDGMGDNDSVEQAPERGSQPTRSRQDTFAERTRFAYLFHMWAEPRRGSRQALWRFRLEEVTTGTRYGFGNFDALVDFLRKRMAMDDFPTP
jgi:hypothetical protein